MGRSRCFPTARSLVALLLTATSLAAVGSDGGRNLAGTYDIRDRVEQDGTCTITFAVLVDNVGDMDMDALALRLASTLNPATTFARFPSVPLPVHASARFSASVELPCEEVDRWNQGVSPLLVADGPPLQLVELVRGPVPEEMPQ